MPSKDPRTRFEDILENIARIETHLVGFDRDAFLDDPKTYDAVERCLERACEASRALGALAEELCPEIPWDQIRGLGNVLRHEYDRIDGYRIWDIVEFQLHPLKTAVTRALAELGEEPE